MGKRFFKDDDYDQCLMAGQSTTALLFKEQGQNSESESGLLNRHIR